MTSLRCGGAACWACNLPQLHLHYIQNMKWLPRQTRKECVPNLKHEYIYINISYINLYFTHNLIDYLSWYNIDASYRRFMAFVVVSLDGQRRSGAFSVALNVVLSAPELTSISVWMSAFFCDSGPFVGAEDSKPNNYNCAVSCFT